MAELTALHIAHVPADLSVYAALYGNLRNAKQLLEELRKQNRELEFSFLDARKILSITQLEAAIFRAISDRLNSRMKSHNVHSEVVLALNMNNNIGESFRKFGMTEDTKDLLVVKITTEPAEKISQLLRSAVDADPRVLSDDALAALADTTEIGKLYKLNAASDRGAARQELQSTILGLIALRGAT